MKIKPAANVEKIREEEKEADAQVKMHTNEMMKHGGQHMTEIKAVQEEDI